MGSEKKLTPISFRPKERELEQIRLIQERKDAAKRVPSDSPSMRLAKHWS